MTNKDDDKSVDISDDEEDHFGDNHKLGGVESDHDLHSASTPDLERRTDGDHRSVTPQGSDSSGSPELGLRDGSVGDSWESHDGSDEDSESRTQEQRLEQIAFAHSGPIPDPGSMLYYGQIDPSFPDRIMKMAEVNVHGRHQSMSQMVRTDNISTLIGSVTMAVVAVGGLAGGIVLIMLDKDVAGYMVFLAPLVIAVGRGVGFARKPSGD